ncbi:MAG TPA: phytanoyl-CoA dioxygenase family protein [Acidimicrobiia bacterium]|jgi:ectoine hydroxylase-related dioxygenase (phytanoyl-CoA dioxygenase family)|nr:phytanoyl-CoA dioxygenase family protein [Acidimicrobiia bacterium]
MLTQEQVELFHEQGFLVVPDVLESGDLDPVADEYATALDAAVADLFARGAISDVHEELPFAERYTAILTENPDLFYYLGISLPLDYEGLDPDLVRAHTGPALFGLLSNPKVLDVAESILGGEITLNPVQQVRLKPPQRLLSGAMAEYSNVGATTWHQDFGAVMDEAADTELLTIWVAMTDVTEEMGCLVAIPGSHRSRGLTLHCPGRLNTAENYIPQALLDRHGTEPVTLPCTQGSLILLTRFTEHGALLNTSDRLRWSFDLRYQPSGQPTGRPAFPSFVLRSRSDPSHEVHDPAVYARRWEETRQRVLSGAHEGSLYEQNRWLANRDHPVCA